MPDHARLKLRARELRNHLTDAERALWLLLRRNNVAGVRFLRQRVVGPFILDFFAPALSLAIEVDGGQHREPSVIRYDARREAWLAQQGIAFLRFTNLEVLQQRQAVLAEIEREVRLLQKHRQGAGG